MGAETSAGRYTPVQKMKRATPYEQQQAARVGALGRAYYSGSRSPAVTPAASRTPAPAPAPSRSSAPVSSNRTGQIAKPSTPAPVAPGPIPEIAPVAPSTNPADYEARVATEPTYAAQETGWQKALADYEANQALQKSQYETDYGEQVRQLGQRRETDLAALLEDYAARGLGQSGVYNEAQEKLRNQFATEESGLATARGQFGEGQVRELGSYKAAQEAERAAARQAAIQRMILAATGG